MVVLKFVCYLVMRNWLCYFYFRIDKFLVFDVGDVNFIVCVQFVFFNLVYGRLIFYVNVILLFMIYRLLELNNIYYIMIYSG